jgi:hypothetical protein
VCDKWRNFEAVLLPFHNILLLTHVAFIKFNLFVKNSLLGEKAHSILGSSVCFRAFAQLIFVGNHHIY